MRRSYIWGFSDLQHWVKPSPPSFNPPAQVHGPVLNPVFLWTDLPEVFGPTARALGNDVVSYNLPATDKHLFEGRRREANREDEITDNVS